MTGKGDIIHKCWKVIAIMHKYREGLTVYQLSEMLGVTYKNAKHYVDCMSLYFPIIEVQARPLIFKLETKNLLPPS